MSRSSTSALKAVLWANAASCLLFGAWFALDSAGVAASLGEAPAWLVLLVGFGLLLNGGHLAMTARKRAVSRAEALYFAAGDFAWVAATLGLALAGLWVTSAAGVAGVFIVAAWVGACGLAQWRMAPAG